MQRTLIFVNQTAITVWGVGAVRFVKRTVREGLDAFLIPQTHEYFARTERAFSHLRLGMKVVPISVGRNATPALKFARAVRFVEAVANQVSKKDAPMVAVWDLAIFARQRPRAAQAAYRALQKVSKHIFRRLALVPIVPLDHSLIGWRNIRRDLAYGKNPIISLNFQ